jgi:hypothetical protein
LFTQRDETNSWQVIRLQAEELHDTGVVLDADHQRLIRFFQNMYLELELFDMPSRSRRNANQPQVCQAGQNNTKCCLYDLMIDFEKVGWEFVIGKLFVDFVTFISLFSSQTVQRLHLPGQLPNFGKFLSDR